MRYLLLLPLLLIGFVVNAQEEQQQEKPKPPATMKVGEFDVTVMPDSRPEYKGGNAAMMEYIMKKVKYTEAAKEDSVEGQVLVRFVVDEKGQVQNAEVMRGIHEDLNKVALDIVNGMPKWIPAKKGDKAVAAQHMVAVRFMLPKE